MAARNRKGLSENTRARIQTTMIVKRLQTHIVSKPEFDEKTNQWINKDLMTASQVTAALGLIRKTLPDLAAVQHTGEITHKHARELTDDELYDIAAKGSSGTVKEEKGTGNIH